MVCRDSAILDGLRVEKAQQISLLVFFNSALAVPHGPYNGQNHNPFNSHKRRKASWTIVIPTALVLYVVFVWIALALWDAKKYDKSGTFCERFKRALCCGGRRNKWHRKCLQCGKFHHCRTCEDGTCEHRPEGADVELRAM
jgi:hypothetical protein